MSIKQNNRHIYLASITVITLLLLIAIQIFWTIKSASQERNNFAQLARIAINKAQSEIIKIYPDCCLNQRKVEGMKGQCKSLGQREHKMDSIITDQLSKFSLNLDYTFVIQSIQKNPECMGVASSQNNSYLDSTQLSIEFPHRNQFLIKQMQGIFITSIAFISIIFIAFFQLLRLLRLEKEKHADTDNFINNMVHEFQTPISNIKLSASMLSKKLINPTDEINKFIEIIQCENDRLKRNTIQILDSNANFDCNKSKEILDIQEAIIRCIGNYKNSAITIKTNFKATNYMIYGNPQSIDHLISNLIDNAIKYSSEKLDITLATASDGMNFSFQIYDKGIGIEKENLKKIFDKYYRVDNQNIHNIKGFGLGLAYVKQIVENLKGTIKVESKINEGSTFSISLPLFKI